nr:MAG TPA: hypothetical protein [Caudoviricetes sp.]
MTSNKLIWALARISIHDMEPFGLGLGLTGMVYRYYI